MEQNPLYIKTTQAAKMLGLSVGTVQKLADAGMLTTHTTQGKHRRIHANSLVKYCLDRGIPLSAQVESRQLAVAPMPSMSLSDSHQLKQEGIHWISSPFDLIGLDQNVLYLLLDARLPWMPWEHIQNKPLCKPPGKVLVFSAHACPPSTRSALAEHILFIDKVLSPALISGFHLALQANAAPAS